RLHPGLTPSPTRRSSDLLLCLRTESIPVYVIQLAFSSSPLAFRPKSSHPVSLGSLLSAQPYTIYPVAYLLARPRYLNNGTSWKHHTRLFLQTIPGPVGTYRVTVGSHHG